MAKLLEAISALSTGDAALLMGFAFLFLTIAASLVLLGLRTFVLEGVKASIHSAYAERLETLKAQLKADADTEIEKIKSQSSIETEKLKSQLSIAAAERQYRSAKLHERRAEVVAELYGLLTTAQHAMTEYVHIWQPAGSPSVEQRQKAAVDAVNALVVYLPSKRIFIPHRIVEKIDDISEKLRLIYIQFQRDIAEAGPDAALTAKWVAATETVTQLSKTALFDLEQEFRVLLGDDLGANNQQ